MKRAVCSLFAIGMALGGGARAWADDVVIGAAVERFTQCLAAEGSGATVDDPAALASALGGTVAQFDGNQSPTARTFPGVSLPSSVVRSTIETANRRPKHFDFFFRLRVLNLATRSSMPT